MGILYFLCLPKWKGSKVTKHTRSAIAHAASGSTRKNLFDESSDDEVREVDEQNDDQDDDRVEIMLITPIRSAAKLPFEGKQGVENSAPSAVEVSSQKDTVDGCFDTPFRNAGHPLSFVGAEPFVISRKEWELPHDLTFEILNKEVFKDLEACKAAVDLFPTPTEVLWVETLFDEQLTEKLSVLHCVISGFQSMAWKFLGSDEFRMVQVELLTLAVNIGFEKGLHINQSKEQLAEAMKKDFQVCPWCPRLELDRLACLMPAPTPRDVVSPPSLKELTITPASPDRELVSKDIPSSSKAADSEQHLKE
uniref:Uncharacterized protein n=1 Tax=Tanacetum cinerariifolium TaxID=118510 RepID=A0A699GHW1_TANCI|nr:hypothetical protein [Tanacetum cinerariifolium]